MKRTSAFLLAAGVAVAAAIGSGAAAAYAEAPAQQGWWTTANPGPLGRPAPAPPDVPPKGLLIEGGASSKTGPSDSGATAYAALVYLFPAGVSVGTLTLTKASSSGSTPGSALELCPLNDPSIRAEQGGPISHAPAFNCKKYSTAQPSGLGSTYQFNVSGLVSGGRLAVALLPTTPAARVVLAQPDAGSLSVPGQTPPPSGPISSPSGFTPPAGTGSGSGSTSGAPAPGVAGSPAMQTAAPGGAAAPSVAALPLSGASSTGTVSAAGVQPALAKPPSFQPSTASGQGGSPVALSTQLSSKAPNSSGVNPLAVGVLLAAVLIGGVIWIAAGKVGRGTAAEEAEEHAAAAAP